MTEVETILAATQRGDCVWTLKGDRYEYPCGMWVLVRIAKYKALPEVAAALARGHARCHGGPESLSDDTDSLGVKA